VAAPSPCSATPRRDGYERRRPDETLLYQLIEEHWPTFLERAEQSGGLPDFVVKEHTCAAASVDEAHAGEAQVAQARAEAAAASPRTNPGSVVGPCRPRSSDEQVLLFPFGDVLTMQDIVMMRKIIVSTILGVIACQPAPAPGPTAPPPDAEEPSPCPEIPEPPQTDLPDCSRAWRVKWCWIQRTGQSDAYEAGVRDAFELYRVDVDQPLPREDVRQICLDVLEEIQDAAEAEGCGVGACVES
jgi:hypothetical protein